MYISEEEAKKYPILYRATFTFISGEVSTFGIVGDNELYYYYIKAVPNYPWEPEGIKIILDKLPKDEIIDEIKMF